MIKYGISKVIDFHRYKITVSADDSYNKVIMHDIFNEAFGIKLSDAFERKVQQAKLRYRKLTNDEFKNMFIVF